MAGTGKSIISRTVAQSFVVKGQLGASFFFKRGESDRGNASRVFTTVTRQLALQIPALIPYLQTAIDANPVISGKSLKEQFEKLIYEPLRDVMHPPPHTSKLVIVVDALDECEREGDIKTILYLLSQTQHLKSVHVRIFLTSRQELPIRLGFKKMSANAHQDVLLHDVPQATIHHDISAFLKDEFAKIRDDHNCDCPQDSLLSPDWPGDEKYPSSRPDGYPLIHHCRNRLPFHRRSYVEPPGTTCYDSKIPDHRVHVSVRANIPTRPRSITSQARSRIPRDCRLHYYPRRSSIHLFSCKTS